MGENSEDGSHGRAGSPVLSTPPVVGLPDDLPEIDAGGVWGSVLAWLAQQTAGTHWHFGFEFVVVHGSAESRPCPVILAYPPDCVHADPPYVAYDGTSRAPDLPWKVIGPDRHTPLAAVCVNYAPDDDPPLPAYAFATLADAWEALCAWYDTPQPAPRAAAVGATGTYGDPLAEFGRPPEDYVPEPTWMDRVYDVSNSVAATGKPDVQQINDAMHHALDTACPVAAEIARTGDHLGTVAALAASDLHALTETCIRHFAVLSILRYLNGADATAAVLFAAGLPAMLVSAAGMRTIGQHDGAARWLHMVREAADVGDHAASSRQFHRLVDDLTAAAKRWHLDLPIPPKA